jgi:polyisoprenoid-binding protein YceI
MKPIGIFILLLFATSLIAQERYYTKSGHINFFSHSPMEDISADNNQVAAFLNVENGELTFAVLIKSFSFEKALMQEHFNENYMESDKYPRATFKGEILEYSKEKLLGGQSYLASVDGILSIRGIEKELRVEVELQLKNKQITGYSKFIVKPEDFKIKIPAVVKDNIAKKIEVSVKTKLEPYSR